MSVTDTRLPPCPSSPNCVGSLEQDGGHFIEPLEFKGDMEETRQKLVETIRSIPRSRVVEEKPGYVRAVFTSSIFRFKDDAEFLLDGEAGIIHMRSAARVGWSDLGVNRKRLETIRQIWNGRSAGS